MPAQKGAFIKLDSGLPGGLPNVVLFDFNPERLTRSVAIAKSPSPEDGGGSENALVQPGQPTDSISFTLLLDATDRLADGDNVARVFGILPDLAALELLQAPQPPAGAAALAAVTSSYASPPTRLPAILFFWGETRVLPVVIKSLSVTETRFDTRLNPIRAEVSVSLQVLPPDRLDPSDKLSRGAYRYTQGMKTALAGLAVAETARNAGLAALKAVGLG
jgi:hypothetical protein